MQTVIGVVSKTNGNGFQLDGSENWLTISRYAEPKPDLPPAGARVRVALDKSGFIRTVAVVGDAPAELPERSNGHVISSGDAPAHGPGDVTTRLACLRAAAEFATSRPEMKSTDVIAVAQRWEAWVAQTE